MKFLARIGLAAAVVLVIGWTFSAHPAITAAAAPQQPETGPYRVLAPIASGNLLLFPVVRAEGKSPGETPFITLDEGIKSGEVEVTEAGNVRGLVRPRPHDGGAWDGVMPPAENCRGDEVNTLVLVNHSKRPLLLLAGEIVTGGKQDRIIAKDRIVPTDADPIDLSVFCIEPGRWTESSETFGASAKAPKRSFMVQPAVRERAMADQNQQEVWDSVHGAIAQMEAAPASSGSSGGGIGSGASADASAAPLPPATTSYAKVMESDAISEKVDEAAAPVMRDREQVLAKLRGENAIGVVVAVRGRIVWADLFANSDLLSRYWTKLVRSYAAESITETDDHAAPSVADAQRFLNAPADGVTETSEGEVGVYRYTQLRSGGAETFVLESLLPGTGYDVHLSKMRLREPVARIHPPQPPLYRAPEPIYPQPIFRPEVYQPDVDR